MRRGIYRYNLGYAGNLQYNNPSIKEKTNLASVLLCRGEIGVGELVKQGNKVKT